MTKRRGMHINGRVVWAWDNSHDIVTACIVEEIEGDPRADAAWIGNCRVAASISPFALALEPATPEQREWMIDVLGRVRERILAHGQFRSEHLATWSVLEGCLVSDGRLRTDVLETAPMVDLVDVVTSALRGTLPPDPEGRWWTYGSPDGRHLTIHVVPAHPGSGHELRTSLLNLRLHEFFWTTSVAVADDRLAHGPIEMVFAPEGRDDRPLTNDEVELVLRAVADLDGGAALAVTAIAARYPALQQSYDYEGADRTTLMPDVDSPDGLLALIELARIYVHPLSRSGVPYVGFEFECTWDPEHGAGVLVNGDRVVDVGGADSAILLWIAERDLRSHDAS